MLQFLSNKSLTLCLGLMLGSFTLIFSSGAKAQRTITIEKNKPNCDICTKARPPALSIVGEIQMHANFKGFDPGSLANAVVIGIIRCAQFREFVTKDDVIKGCTGYNELVKPVNNLANLLILKLLLYNEGAMSSELFIKIAYCISNYYDNRCEEQEGNYSIL